MSTCHGPTTPIDNISHSRHREGKNKKSISTRVDFNSDFVASKPASPKTALPPKNPSSCRGGNFICQLLQDFNTSTTIQLLHTYILVQVQLSGRNTTQIIPPVIVMINRRVPPSARAQGDPSDNIPHLLIIRQQTKKRKKVKVVHIV